MAADDQSGTPPFPALSTRISLSLLLALLFAGAALVVACGTNAENRPGGGDSLPKLPSIYMPPSTLIKDGDITLAIRLSDEQQAVTVYQAAPYREADDRYVESIATKLGIVGKPERNSDGVYEVDSGAGSVTVWGENNFSFVRTPSQETGTGTAGDEELSRQAETFLSEYGLLPANAQFQSVDSHRIVNFRNRLVSPGIGGPLVDVVVDPNGVVTQFRYDWPDLIRLGDYPLLSEKQAFERIFEGGVFVTFRHFPAQVDSVQLSFHEERAENGENVYVPFYWFRGPDDGSIRVPAVRDEYIQGPNGGP